MPAGLGKRASPSRVGPISIPWAGAEVRPGDMLGPWMSKGMRPSLINAPAVAQVIVLVQTFTVISYEKNDRILLWQCLENSAQMVVHEGHF